MPPFERTVAKASRLITVTVTATATPWKDLIATALEALNPAGVLPAEQIAGLIARPRSTDITVEDPTWGTATQQTLPGDLPRGFNGANVLEHKAACAAGLTVTTDLEILFV